MKTIQKNTVLFFIFITTLSITSCKKNEAGGEAEIHALIYHGETPVIGTTTLYVKFDAKTQPSDPTTDYDMKLQGDEDDNHVHVESLHPGNYYLYAAAFDSLDMKAVKGGAPVTIKWKERKQMSEVRIQTN